MPLEDRIADYAGSLMAQKPQAASMPQIMNLARQFYARNMDPATLPPNLSGPVSDMIKMMREKEGGGGGYAGTLMASSR